MVSIVIALFEIPSCFQIDPGMVLWTLLRMLKTFGINDTHKNTFTSP